MKFTEKGIEKLDRSPHNRPQIIEKNENIYTFYCKEFNAIIYFPQFFNDIEILEPLDIKNNFIKKFNETMNIYNP